jgi:S-formylglutathione hydrolase
LSACFNLFLPAKAANGKVPVLFYLAGLTCTEDNGYAGLTAKSDVIPHIFYHSALRKGVFSVLQPKRASRSFSPILHPVAQGSKARMIIGISAQVWHSRNANVLSEITISIGAGFYLNATNPKYARHYNMSTHIQLEIPQILETAALPIVSAGIPPSHLY